MRTLGVRGLVAAPGRAGSRLDVVVGLCAETDGDCFTVTVGCSPVGGDVGTGGGGVLVGSTPGRAITAGVVSGWPLTDGDAFDVTFVGSVRGTVAGGVTSLVEDAVGSGCSVMLGGVLRAGCTAAGREGAPGRGPELPRSRPLASAKTPTPERMAAATPSSAIFQRLDA